MVFIILLFDTFFGDRVILQEFLLNRFVYDIIMLADRILVATNKVYDAFVRHFLRLRNLGERTQGHRGVFGVALVHNQLLVQNLYFHSDSAAWVCEFEGVWQKVEENLENSVLISIHRFYQLKVSFEIYLWS